VLVLHDRSSGTSEALGLNEGPAALSADGGVIALTTGQGVASSVVVLRRASGSRESLGRGFDVHISANGRFVAFMEVADEPFGVQDVILHDLTTGAEEPVSVSAGGAPADAVSGPSDISADGRFVAFMSYATNLVPGDTNGVPDIFVRDRASSPTELLRDLRQLIRSFGLPKGLETSLLRKARPRCGPLAALAHQARAQAGKKLSLAQAMLVIADARQLSAALGCGR
jgi:hypothetical protein